MKFDFHGQTAEIKHGSIVIAAITSCTNTSNPTVMITSGLVALFSRRGLGIHAPSTDLRLARLGARLARLGVQPPHLARRPPYRLENRGWLQEKLVSWALRSVLDIIMHLCSIIN